MKNCIFTTVFLLLFTSCGYGTMRVFVNPDSKFSRKTPVTINQSSDDVTGTLGELKFLLQSNGYTLMSYDVAKKTFNLDTNSENQSFHGEVTKTTSFKSAYVIDLDYTYYNLFYYAYSNFSATITDLETGEIIMTANFRGGRSCRSVLEELVGKMNTVIK